MKLTTASDNLNSDDIGSLYRAISTIEHEMSLQASDTKQKFDRIEKDPTGFKEKLELITREYEEHISLFNGFQQIIDQQKHNFTIQLQSEEQAHVKERKELQKELKEAIEREQILRKEIQESDRIEQDCNQLKEQLDMNTTTHEEHIGILNEQHAKEALSFQQTIDQLNHNFTIRLQSKEQAHIKEREEFEEDHKESTVREQKLQQEIITGQHDNASLKLIVSEL